MLKRGRVVWEVGWWSSGRMVIICKVEMLCQWMDVVEPGRKEEEMKKETDIEALLLARLLLVTNCEEGIKALRQV
jgi:hypothetical protein